MGEQEQKTITITVPFTMGPTTLPDGCEWRQQGHECLLFVRRGGLEAMAEADVVQREMARAAWPSEPTTDRAKRLAEIDAAIASAPRGVWSWEPHGNGWALYIDRGEPIDRDAPRGFCNAQHGWKILTVDRTGFDAHGEALRAFILAAGQHMAAARDEIRAADAALTALGVADDGRPLAERIGELHHWYDALHRAAVNIVCDRGDKARWSGLSRMGEAITRIAAEDSAALIVLRGLALATWVNSGAERERFLLLLGGALFDQGLMWDRASFPLGDPSPAGEKLLAAVYKAHGAPQEEDADVIAATERCARGEHRRAGETPAGACADCGVDWSDLDDGPCLELGEVDHHGELALNLSVGEHKGTVWLSREMWERMGEVARWTGSAPLDIAPIRARHEATVRDDMDTGDGMAAHDDREDLLGEVDRLRDVVTRANNALFDVLPEADDPEHVIECHRDTLPDTYRRLAAGVETTADILAPTVAAMVEPSAPAGSDEPQAGGRGLTAEQAAARYPDALAGLSPEQHAHLTALATDPARRARFNGSTARIALLSVLAHPHRSWRARVREHLNAEFGLSITVEDLARALGISPEDMLAIEVGAKTTDDAGWKEILTACFLLGSGTKPEHIADPTSSPAFQRAMEREEDDAPEEAAPAAHSPEAMWRDLAAPAASDASVDEPAIGGEP